MPVLRCPDRPKPTRSSRRQPISLDVCLGRLEASLRYSPAWTGTGHRESTDAIPDHRETAQVTEAYSCQYRTGHAKPGQPVRSQPVWLRTNPSHPESARTIPGHPRLARTSSARLGPTPDHSKPGRVSPGWPIYFHSLMLNFSIIVIRFYIYDIFVYVTKTWEK